MILKMFLSQFVEKLLYLFNSRGEFTSEFIHKIFDDLLRRCEDL